MPLCAKSSIVVLDNLEDRPWRIVPGVSLTSLPLSFALTLSALSPVWRLNNDVFSNRVIVRWLSVMVISLLTKLQS